MKLDEYILHYKDCPSIMVDEPKKAPKLEKYFFLIMFLGLVMAFALELLWGILLSAIALGLQLILNHNHHHERYVTDELRAKYLQEYNSLKDIYNEKEVLRKPQDLRTQT